MVDIQTIPVWFCNVSCPTKLFRLYVSCTWSNGQHSLTIYMEINARNPRVPNWTKIFLDSSEALQKWYIWFPNRKHIKHISSGQQLLQFSSLLYEAFYFFEKNQPSIILSFMFQNIGLVKFLTDKSLSGGTSKEKPATVHQRL